MPTPTNPYWEDYNKIVFEKLQSEAAKFQTDATAQDKYAAGLQKKIKDTVTKIVRTHIELGQTRRASAEEVLASAMSSLDEVDRLRFVLTNMLEALKRGDQLSTIIDRYNASGLTEIEVVEAGMPQVQVAGAAPLPKPAGLIWSLLGKLGSFCQQLIKMAIAAVKAVAKRLNIKIKPIVGGTLFGPTLAFSFDYEVEFEVEKLWEVLDSALVSAAHPG